MDKRSAHVTVGAHPQPVADGDVVARGGVVDLQQARHHGDVGAAAVAVKSHVAGVHGVDVLLEYEGKTQAWIGYKESSGSGNAAFKVNQYYHTEWMPVQELPLRMEGLSIDAVYENFVRQIAGDNLAGGQTESLKEAVDRSEKKAQLEKQIFALQAKIRKEKQLNVQMKLNTELKRLKKELEEMIK